MHFHACGGESGPRALDRHPRTHGRCKCIWTAKEQSCRIIHHISLPCSTHIQREALRAENRPSWWSARTALHSPISRSRAKKQIISKLAEGLYVLAGRVGSHQEMRYCTAVGALRHRLLANRYSSMIYQAIFRAHGFNSYYGSSRRI